MSTPRNRWTVGFVPAALVVVAVIAISLLLRDRSQDQAAGAARPIPTQPVPTQSAQDTDGTREVSMSEVLEMATNARRHLADTLDDYTARLVKQEMDSSGTVGPETEISVKIQTRLRGDVNDAPLRAYLRFLSPESVKGREVVWGEDLYDGKMAVHEVGLLFSLKTLWLDPNGIIAMQGQRYPISQIGLVGLVEQLIERGKKDRDNPDVRITLTEHHQFENLDTKLIRVHRLRPSGETDDFSLAEIVIDPQRQLILSFRSFGWPPTDGGDAPILESYTYLDVKTNVGLSDSDFDTKNPEYGFPAL